MSLSGAWETFWNWWSPQPDTCGDLFGDIGGYVGLELQTPEALKDWFCAMEKSYHVPAAVIAVIGAEEFIRRGGPRWAYDHFRSKTPGELIMDGVKLYLAQKYGIEYAVLLMAVQKELDSILPSIRDEKRHQKLQQDLKRINGKAQKAQYAAQFNTPEMLGKVDATINESIVKATKSFIEMFGAEYVSESTPAERKEQLVKALQAFLIDGTLPGNSVADEIVAVDDASLHSGSSSDGEKPRV